MVFYLSSFYVPTWLSGALVSPSGPWHRHPGVAECGGLETLAQRPETPAALAGLLPSNHGPDSRGGVPRGGQPLLNHWPANLAATSRADRMINKIALWAAWSRTALRPNRACAGRCLIWAISRRPKSWRCRSGASGSRCQWLPSPGPDAVPVAQAVAGSGRGALGLFGCGGGAFDP